MGGTVASDSCSKAKCWGGAKKSDENEHDGPLLDNDGDPIRTEGTGDLELGCEIHIYEDIEKVKAAFTHKLVDQERWKWEEGMENYLGKKFHVREIPVLGVVGIPSDDGGDKLTYFPTGAIYIES